MNKNQVQDQANKEKGKVKEAGGKTTGDKSTEQKGKSGKQSGKSGAVLGEINDDPKKKSK
ncbi:CsbD family protein [Saccharospirillum sp.]|uniref:CsbD family protein n=1 Tax=Saccharospirillum sp. TaxID=2033801 RepID=UPI0034A08210